MSLFVENAVRFDGDSLVNNVAWSEIDPVGAMAASTLDNEDQETFQVLFLNTDGSLIRNSSVVHDHEATILLWQPKNRVIAIGWADGMLSCWSVDGRIRPTSTFSNSSHHTASISCMRWSPNGKRLVTGDRNGLVVVWAVDARGTLTATRNYRKKGEVTSLTFCTMPNKAPGKTGQTYSPSFFFGTSRGGLVYADDLGNCADVHQLSSAVDKMLYFEEPSRLIVITRSLMLIQYQVSADGRVSRISQVKLSVAGDVADKGLQSVEWAGPGILAAACHEKMVRIFDVAADEAYNLSLSVLGDLVDRGDRVVAVGFSPVDRYLAIGTMNGVVAVWRFTGDARNVSLVDGESATSTSQSDWALYYKVRLPSRVHKVCWSAGQGILACVLDDGVTVLTESRLTNAHCAELSVLQTSAHDVSVQTLSHGDTWLESTGFLIQGMSAANVCFCAWSGKQARVFTLDQHLRRSDAMEAFATTSKSIVIGDTTHLAEEALFAADAQMVRILNFAGHQKGSITFSETEGNPTYLDLKGPYLVIMTDKHIVKIMDVHVPTKPKPIGSAGKFEDKETSEEPTASPVHADTPAFGNKAVFFAESTQAMTNKPPPLQIRVVRVNNAGTRVAILADRVQGALGVRHPDSRLHVFDRSKGCINTYDFKDQGRCPVSVFWDDHDDRLLCVEATKSGGSTSASVNTSQDEFASTYRTDTEEKEAEVEVTLLFVTPEHGILLQDSFPRKAPYGAMIGISCPNMFFRSAPPPTGEDGLPTVSPLDDLKVTTKVMRDFVGLETEVDTESRLALLEFSYNLTLGKLDEAYRAVKMVDSPSIWENMAQMCVKTRRLDVAELCLGHMGHARGAAAVRDAKAEGASKEACIGTLAVHLGLLDDAAKLFREAKRFDLLNKLYQSAGQWEKAIKVAAEKDRIHLKTTHFHFAKHLESIGDVEGAIKQYEESGTFRNEVPRMLHNLGLMPELEDYVHRSADKELLKWWAAYLESKGRYDKAKKYYSKANDFLSLVRIACFKGDFATAAEIVAEAGDKAASYHFARQLESQGEHAQAITYYASAGCYNQAIRLSRTYNMDGELMRFALKSTPSLMLDCASHFEQKGDMDKAIQLFHKGGDLAHALDLCFKSGGGKGTEAGGVYDMMNAIAADLGENTSPQTLARCAEFLVQHKQYERAADLYIMAKRIPQAIEMCFNYRVTISEDMLEKLNPPEDMDAAAKKDALKDLAKALKRQGSFALASKKYTQAGDRVRAIKCLVRSGDTKAVIQFASISRTPEIYKLAANYLQQMNWRESHEIMKAIITFYTKARAFEQLAGFYDSCAQVEMDEYRDYEKAHGALREALKQIGRAEDNGSGYVQRMAQEMKARIELIARFVQARKAAKKEPMAMVSMCEALLKEPNIEEAIRVEDCMAMLIEHHHANGNMGEAYRHVQEIEARGSNVRTYVEGDVLDAVCRAVGAPASPPKQSRPHHSHKQAKNASDDDDEGGIEEDIAEELGSDDEKEQKRAPTWGRPYAAPKGK